MDMGMGMEGQAKTGTRPRGEISAHVNKRRIGDNDGGTGGEEGMREREREREREKGEEATFDQSTLPPESQRRHQPFHDVEHLNLSALP